MNKYLILLLMLLGTFSSGFSQCAMYEVGLDQKAEQASIIIEGKVVQQKSFWGPAEKLIYTSNIIEVYKVFKGDPNLRRVELITEGGVVGMEATMSHPALELRSEEVGIIFLKPTRIFNSRNGLAKHLVFQPWSGPQGMLKYDMDGQAIAPFHVYKDIKKELYPSLISKTGGMTEVRAYEPPSPRDPEASSGRATPNITSFTPSTLNAGTGDTLTINGTDFETYDGGTNSQVQFRNADNGGAGFIVVHSSNIVSWSNTQIKVKVQTRAGTGTFRVQNGTSVSLDLSSTALTIDFNHTNLLSGGLYRQTHLLDDNTSGGYDLQYNTNAAANGVNFNASTAAAAFDSAKATWNCGTNFNIVKLGSISDTTVSGGSSPHLVMFDQDNDSLPSGVLGRASSGYSSCDGGNDWHVQGFDIRFRRDGHDGITWNFGPGATGGCCYDLESVALHELGHAHQLGHVIDNSIVMNYSISNGTDTRSLDATSDVAGGNFVMAASVGYNECGGSKTGMTSFSCGALPITWLTFTGENLMDGTNHLKWRTTEEYGNTGFEIQRSESGIDFEKIGFHNNIQPSNKVNQYTFSDKFLNAPGYYYRLKQIDENGAYDYSDVIHIYTNIATTNTLRNIYPNPFKQTLTLEFSTYSGEEPVQVTMMDLTGRILLDQMMIVEGQKLTVNTDQKGISGGMYLLEVVMGESHVIRKVVKY